MRKLLLVVFLSVFTFADTLVLQNGWIEAHTEIFGDSNINPKTQSIISTLKYDNTIESIKGKIKISSTSLKSEKEDRDKNMYELLKTDIYPNIIFNIIHIQKKDEQFELTGKLTLNSLTKEVKSIVKIDELENALSMNGTFNIKLTQFDIKPPKLLFLTVRDQIDIKYNLRYKKDNK